ncbi:MAG: 30S ribosomal protein S18 [Candidatus Ancillula sp.]|nr:30S ribosomal protein S18 [Candidatus Ancillula sp.]
MQKIKTPEVSPLKNTPRGDINYKNVDLLKKFIQDRGKIRSREITGVTIQEQRLLSTAIKNARELALLPYVAKTSGSNSNRKGGRKND